MHLRIRQEFLRALSVAALAVSFGACDDAGINVSDAAVGCGNGVLEAGEQCDDSNNTNGDGCSSTCQIETADPECGNGTQEGTEECDDGNVVSGDGCSSTCTSETAAFCGDGTVDDGEECDDGNNVDGDGCDAACATEGAECGDGNVDDGEACDDGNTENGDGCSDACVIEPTCGDGNVDDGETCDDGNVEPGDGCDATCQTEPTCGDGNVDDGETCDDGNVVDGDGCDATCQTEPTCGDGNVDDGETCDDGNVEPGDGCDATCNVETTCGDGEREDGEDCDDGNIDNGDGCDENCVFEPAVCGDGVLQMGETCDDGNVAQADGCSPDCIDEIPCIIIDDCDVGQICARSFCVDEAPPVVCGDGLIEGDEQCDDGNDVPGDLCDENCQIEIPDPVCGNMIVEEGELCDDGNLINDDGCNENCLVEGCGNGLLELGEECDDGNLVVGDLCDGNCLIERVCGDMNLTDDEQCDDGNVEPGDGCDADCNIEPECGNGMVEAGEECDDSNLDPDDGCSPECILDIVCGNGVRQVGETCDDGNILPADGCDATCQIEDGFVFPLAPEGECVQVGGAIDDMDPNWMRPGVLNGDPCAFDDANDHFYEVFRFVNAGPMPQFIDATAMWGGDGYVHIFDENFAADMPLVGCLTGDDDFAIGGAGATLGSQITGFEVLPGQTFVMVASTYGSGSTTGAYGIDVCSVPPPARCNDGIVQPENGEECDDGNNIDDDGCSALCQRDPVCGDGFVDGLEECDDSNIDVGDGCDAECQREPVCGDTFVDDPEQCDDGNRDVGDGCDADCVFESVCGNGAIEGLEQCDDGNIDAGDGCNVDCAVEQPDALEIAPRGEAIAIEGALEDTDFTWNRLEEDCVALDRSGRFFDFYRVTNATGADQMLRITSAWGGDSYLYAFTDPFNPLDAGGCIVGGDDFGGTLGSQLTDVNIADGQTIVIVASTYNAAATGAYNIEVFTQHVCGDDLFAEGIEECDDGNLDNGDGCNEACLIEAVCGDNEIGLDEECDDGNADAGDGCDDACQIERICGNGLLTDDEECDDGNVENGDRCDENCVIEAFCGDGNVDEGEECDDGDVVPDDGCDALCQVERICGNGLISDDEECDDGNLVDGDGCDAACALEEGPLAIALPDGTVNYGGEIDDADELWARPNANCTPTNGVDHFYETQIIVNNTGADQAVRVTASWSGDGYVHVFRMPFDAAVLDTCVIGDDDFAVVEGVGRSGSRVDTVDIADGEMLVIVASTFIENVATGPYSVEVYTLPICGDGVVQGDEACDDQNDDDFDGCTNACAAGPVCGDSAVDDPEACDDGNRDDDDGCDASCQTTCGDGIAAGDEECDDGNDDELDGCTSACVIAATCGDDALEDPEACDDGNRDDGDGCDANCQIEEACGNGFVEDPEACDDGNTVDGDGCDANCQFEIFCGNGNVDEGETCDDGNADNGDGCDANCIIEQTCGNGEIEGTEQCDDGNVDAGDGCDAECAIEQPDALPIAPRGEAIELVGALEDGDLTWERPDEDCAFDNRPGRVLDFYRVTNETGADQMLRITGAWSGDSYLHVFSDPFDPASLDNCIIGDDDFEGLNGSQLTDIAIADGETLVIVASAWGAAATGDYTVEVFTQAVCGDGDIHDEETCDDANLIPADGCDDLCRAEVCGDGIVVAIEECDDGNLEDGDGCDANCVFESTCGNDLIEGLEQCDDGNTDAGDGCDADCAIEQPDAIDIAPRGESILLEGALEEGDLLWARLNAACGETGFQGRSVDFYRLTNNTGADQQLAALAAWGGDGYLYAFSDPFNPADAGNCIIGNDDFGGTGGSRVTDVAIADGQTIVIVASSYNAGFTGAYTLDVLTQHVCGDNLLGEGVEECDDGNLDDGDGCDANCEIEPGCGNGQIDDGEACDDGNLDNGDGCDDACQFEIFCGNGNVDEGEECDDGNIEVGDGCDATCQFEQVCGNGEIEGTETCDDGNVDAGDGCDADCLVEEILPIAERDGTVSYVGDVTDQGPQWARPNQDCSASVGVDHFFNAQTIVNNTGVDQTVRVTGFWTNNNDGYLHAFTMPFDPAVADTCVAGDDDFALVVGEGRNYSRLESVNIPAGSMLVIVASTFSANVALGPFSIDVYTLPVCGDGEVQGEEICDDGNDDDSDGCTNACEVGPVCGDGNVDEPEACDDGARVDGDGCDANCAFEIFCGNSNVDEGEQCDDGNADAGDGCDAACQREPVCGDGFVDGDEECDDGNVENGDLCSAACEFEQVCGNGDLEGTELCDDGNLENGDGCDAVCTPEVIAFVLANEQRGNATGEGQNDDYTFTVDHTQSLVTISTSSPGDCFDDADTTVGLFPVNGDGTLGNRVAFNDDVAQGERCSRIEQLLDAGDYLIRVRGFLGAAIGPYTLDYRLETDVSATGAFNGALAVGGTDLFVFDLAADGRVILETDDGAGTCDFDTQMNLFPIDVDGNRGDAIFDDDDGAGFCSLIDQDLTAGRYEVVINEFDNNDAIEAYTLTVSIPVCGNGRVDADETCDDGNLDAGDGCDAACLIEPGCGNGQVDDGEACDDGNLDNGDGCDDQCQIELAGCFDDFEGADLSPAYVLDGEADWFIDAGFASSGDITDNEISSLSIGANIVAGGRVSFTYRVSSEDGFDFLEFRVDGALVERWSGEDTANVAFDLEPGLHTLSWVFDKDGSASAGEDRGLIDNLIIEGAELCPFEPGCGNAVVDAGEACDDGNLVDGDGCDAACAFEAECGNGAIEGDEECDDGNLVNGDNCSDACVIENPPAEGDIRLMDGAAENEGRIEVFAAGVWGTVCDDNWESFAADQERAFRNGDVACQQLGFLGAAAVDIDVPDGVDPIHLDNVACEGAEARLFDCPANPLGDSNCGHNEDVGVRCLLVGECRIDSQCDGALVCIDGACAENPCGNGQIDGDEECDDGNLENGDNCSDACLNEIICGDGELEAGEECDDGNDVNGDGCSDACVNEIICGDGELEDGEECDDGNLDNLDGCDAECSNEFFNDNQAINRFRSRMAAGSSDTIRFTLDGPGRILFQSGDGAFGCTADTRAQLYVVNPDGTQGAPAGPQIDNGLNPIAPQCASALLTGVPAGTYDLEIAEQNDGAIADYALDVLVAVDVVIESSSVGIIPAGGTDGYFFAVENPDTELAIFTDTAPGECPDTDTVMQVFTINVATGQLTPLVNNDDGGTPNCSRVQQVFQPGNYAVVVNEFGNNDAIDAYNLNVECISCVNAARPGADDLVITEIMQNPSALSDAVGEYFEAINVSDTDVDLFGVLIRDDGTDDFRIEESIVVPAGGYAIFARSDDANNGGIGATVVYETFFLGNGDDEVVLENWRGVEIDRVNYDNGDTFPDPSGVSMQFGGDPRVDGNNDGALWCESTSAYGAGDLGTPGADNDGCAVVGPAIVELSYAGFDVSENPVEIVAGTTVRWTNTDGANHDVVSGNPGDMDAGDLFRSPLLGTGDTFEHTFNDAGQFTYFCAPHSGSMRDFVINVIAAP